MAKRKIKAAMILTEEEHEMMMKNISRVDPEEVENSENLWMPNVVYQEETENTKDQTAHKLPLGIREKIDLESVLRRAIRRDEYLSEEDKKSISNVLEKLENLKFVFLGRKRTATKNANAAKISKSKEKVQNAINILRMEGSEITAYGIAKVGNVSYNTAKKYLSQMEIEKS